MNSEKYAKFLEGENDRLEEENGKLRAENVRLRGAKKNKEAPIAAAESQSSNAHDSACQ